MSDKQGRPHTLVLFSRKFHPAYLRYHPEDVDLIPDDIPHDEQIASLMKQGDALLEGMAVEVAAIDKRIKKIESLQRQ